MPEATNTFAPPVIDRKPWDTVRPSTPHVGGGLHLHPAAALSQARAG